jgi:hypothetical protein
VDRWSLRVPSVLADTTYSQMNNMLPAIREWIEAEERGGEVASAKWPDGVSYRGTLGTFYGKVVDKKGNGKPGIIVRLRDTDYLGSSASDGRFGIAMLLPGPYNVDVIDPDYLKLGITFPTKLQFTARRDSITEGELRDPNTVSYVIQGCTGERWSNAAPLDLTLQVETHAGVPIKHAEWEISRPTKADWQRIRERRVTDNDGRIYSCLRMDKGTVVDIRLFQGDRQLGAAKAKVPGDRTIQTVKITPPRP